MYSLVRTNQCTYFCSLSKKNDFTFSFHSADSVEAFFRCKITNTDISIFLWTFIDGIIIPFRINREYLRNICVYAHKFRSIFFYLITNTGIFVDN